MANGAPGPAADALVALVRSADLDGLDPGDYRPRALEKAVAKARETGSPEALARAELMLSRALVRYVRDVRKPHDVGMTYADPALLPSVPSARGVLDAAARARSLAAWLNEGRWANPLYADLRRAYAATEDRWDKAQRRVIRLNLDRARALPANPGKRYVLVDAAAARLWAYEDGKVAETMRVIVGKADNQTPMLASTIRFAVLNPYWNVPPDLARERIAPHVVEQGQSYLKAHRYELLSDWSEDARRIDASLVDWSAVASGAREVRVRQLPGPSNGMGRMKFMFANPFGVYLHDTPDKQLFTEAARLYSAGCVRLQDAPRLGRWLFGKTLKPSGAKPEQAVPLKEPVPVYITYLTVAPDGDSLVFRDDIYGRDGGGKDGAAAKFAAN